MIILYGYYINYDSYRSLLSEETIAFNAQVNKQYCNCGTIKLLRKTFYILWVHRGLKLNYQHTGLLVVHFSGDPCYIYIALNSTSLNSKYYKLRKLTSDCWLYISRLTVQTIQLWQFWRCEIQCSVHLLNDMDMQIPVYNLSKAYGALKAEWIIYISKWKWSLSAIMTGIKA